MSPLTEILRDEIRRDGPISFRRFMEAALYDPAHDTWTAITAPAGWANIGDAQSVDLANCANDGGVIAVAEGPA